MAVLALDLATRTGWALHAPGMERPFFGTRLLKTPNQNNGDAAESLRQLLAEKHNLHGLTDIVFEEQHLPGPKKVFVNGKWITKTGADPQTIYRLIGLGFMTEWFGTAIGIGDHVFKMPIGTWRKAFIGKGNYKTEEAKKRAVDQCRMLGWHPQDHNAAEAGGILDTYLNMLPPERNHPIPWRDATLLAGFRT